MRGQLWSHHFVFLASYSKHYDSLGSIIQQNSEYAENLHSASNGIPFELWKHWQNSLNVWPKNYAVWCMPSFQVSLETKAVDRRRR